MRYLDREQRDQIGFSYILDNLDITTNIGMKFKKDLMPFGIKKKSELEREFDYVEEVMEKIIKAPSRTYSLGESFCRIKDISNSVRRLINGNVMDEVELYEVKCFAKVSDDIFHQYHRFQLSIDPVKLKPLTDVFHLLDPEKKNILTFHVYDCYSDELAEIRKNKRNLEKLIGDESDEAITEKLLSERLTVVIQEEEEELKIRTRLSEQIRFFGDNILQNLESIGRLDFLMAKAKYAFDHGAVKPTLTDGIEVDLQNATNPLVKDILAKNNKEFTPISINMEKGTTIITGANMGGKSITINTITLNIFLAQMGFYVFCEKAEVPVYDFVYFISDDMQSVERGLSTFGAEIIRLKEVVGAARVAKGFIALDELARGTNPKEGRDIVQGIIYFLKDKNVNSLISTHYDGIDTNGSKHYQVVGLKNLNFEKLKKQIDLNKKSSIDLIQENMDYHLEEVCENIIPKDALNIANLLGLDAEILTIIENFYKE